MICNLNPEKFYMFGEIPQDGSNSLRRINHHTIALTDKSAAIYQTAADTWLAPQSGSTVLSTSLDGERYWDFYLDKPVVLRKGILFSLTGFRGNAAVQMAGFSLPGLVETRVNEEQFVVRPQLQVSRIYSLFYQEMEPKFRIPEQLCSTMELMYVDRGQLHCIWEEADVLLHQGDVILFSPGQSYGQYADGEEAPRLVCISFDAEGIKWQKLTRRKFASCQRAVFLLRQMLTEQERMEPGAEDMIFSLLSQLLLTLQRQAGAAKEKLQSAYSVQSEHEVIRRAQDYVAQHVREKLTVPIVAQGTGVSASYLTALFQKHLQLSPGEYIRRIKLQESRQMIREGNMNFTQIAETLHYSTIHQFSRQFKEKFGITPTQYAKSVRG